MKRIGTLALVAAVLVLSVALVAPQAPPPAAASSHREAPLIAQDPVADATDLYAFVSPDRPDTVTIIANYYPGQLPMGGPNFYPFGTDVLYEINVDNVGDARPHLKYQFQFQQVTRNGDTFLYNTGPITSIGGGEWNRPQAYSVVRADLDARGNWQRTNLSPRQTLLTPPANVGFQSTPDYDTLAAQATYTIGDGVRVFAGQRDDPFFVDLGAVFDLLRVRKLPGNMGGGVDALAGLNVNTIALQIPISQLTRDGSVPASKDAAAAVIGIWTTASRHVVEIKHVDVDGNAEPFPTENWRQVSRLGHPLVNEVVVPLAFKDVFNASEPKDDARFLAKVTDPEVPKLLNAIYQINVPPTPRLDLVAVFLTGVPGLTMPPNVVPSEMLRLNVAIKPTTTDVNAGNRMGVLGGDLGGFPNGRRLGDDVIDSALQVMAGALVPGFDTGVNVQLGDGVDKNDTPFLSSFPYVASPHSGDTK